MMKVKKNLSVFRILYKTTLIFFHERKKPKWPMLELTDSEFREHITAPTGF